MRVLYEAHFYDIRSHIHTHATIIWGRLENATTAVVGTHFSGFDRFILYREVCVQMTTRNRNLLGIISYVLLLPYYIIIIITIMLDQKTRNSRADRGAGRRYIPTTV